jgi:hypothetical protein
MPTKEKRYAISISNKAGNALRRLQEQLEREVGFVPSMSQVVEYLAIQYTKPPTLTIIPKNDKLTGGQHV